MRRTIFGLLRRSAKPAGSLPSRTVKPKLECLEGRIAPATLNVGGNQQYKTITAALNAASAGDTVSVYNGTYDELVKVTKANIKLQAASKQNPTIQPDSTKISIPSVTVNGVTGGAAVIDVSASNVTVSGFNVDGSKGGSNLWAGIRALGGVSGETISNNTVQHFVSAPLGNVGIQLGSNYFGTPAFGTVSGNTISDYVGVGVEVDGTNTPATMATTMSTVSGNNINGRDAGNSGTQFGVQVSYGALANVSGNTISNNSVGNQSTVSAGIFYYQASVQANSNISGNTLTHNYDGILVQQTSGSSSAFVTVSGNTIKGSTGYAGIDIYASNYVHVNGNTVTGNNSLNGIALTGPTPGTGAAAGNGSQYVQVNGNTITNNNGSFTDGIYDYQGAHNTINGNTATGNSGNGINLDHSTQDVVSSNTLFSGGTFNTLYGISLTATTNSTGTGNSYGATPRKYQQDAASTGNSINQS
jgi:parallel beta-helix repeat protein